MFVPRPLHLVRHFFFFGILLLLLGAFTFPHAISATQFFLGGTTTRVSVASDGTEGNKESYSSAVSGDGQYVVFMSYADSLVVGDTNGTNDLFLHDIQTGGTTRISVATSGAQANSGSYLGDINQDGRYTNWK